MQNMYNEYNSTNKKKFVVVDCIFIFFSFVCKSLRLGTSFSYLNIVSDCLFSVFLYRGTGAVAV